MRPGGPSIVASVGPIRPRARASTSDLPPGGAFRTRGPSGCPVRPARTSRRKGRPRTPRPRSELTAAESEPPWVAHGAEVHVALAVEREGVAPAPLAVRGRGDHFRRGPVRADLQEPALVAVAPGMDSMCATGPCSGTGRRGGRLCVASRRGGDGPGEWATATPPSRRRRSRPT